MSENNKKIPVTRLNKFFSDEDFLLEQNLSREFIEGDLNMTVILYRVDRDKSAVDDIYGESTVEEIRYLPPIELAGLVKIEAPQNKSYGPKSSLRFLEIGNLIFSVHQALLDELDVDIRYGDYIAYPISETSLKYFTVSNDGKVFFDNAHTNKGYRGFYRTITCTPVNDSEFKGI